LTLDSHQHFWKYNPASHSWITDEMSVLRRDFLPPELEGEMARTGFDGCIAVQAAQTEAENDFLLGLADSYDFIKGVVGWVDLRSKNVGARLEHYARHPKFVGVRHIVQSEPDPNFLLQKDFLRGINILQDFNLTYDILVFPKHLNATYQFVKIFPNQPFVIDHLAKPYIKQGRIKQWEKDIRRTARCENVWCKLSGMVTEADWKTWKPNDLTPYLDIALEAFGPSRLMIGSDWPVCKLAAEYHDVMKVVIQYIRTLTPNEQTRILGLTAWEFYGGQ
jgi:L-fuconolactonase